MDHHTIRLLEGDMQLAVEPSISLVTAERTLRVFLLPCWPGQLDSWLPYETMSMHWMIAEIL